VSWKHKKTLSPETVTKFQYN